MTKTTGLRSLAAAVLTLFAMLMAFAAPASADPTDDSRAAVVSVVEMRSAAGLADCPAGWVCFWTGANYTDSMCRWSGDDDNWYAAPGYCSWTNHKQVRSVYNHGTSTAFRSVYFYQGTNGLAYNGCMGRGWAGNIGPVYLRSHYWTSASC